MVKRLPDVSISGLELSDLFFNYPNLTDNSIKEQAQDFLNSLPSLEAQGVTVEFLIEDYNNRL